MPREDFAMMRRTLAIAVLAAVSATAPAWAQQAPPSPPPFSRTPMELDRHMDQIRHAQQAEFEQFRDSATGNNLASQPIERIDLANRISTLIELGRCNEARTLANEADERMMAMRVRQMCREGRPRPAAND